MYSYLFVKELVNQNKDLLSDIMPDSFEAVVDFLAHYESSDEACDLENIEEDISLLIDCVEHNKIYPIR